MAAVCQTFFFPSKKCASINYYVVNRNGFGVYIEKKNVIIGRERHLLGTLVLFDSTTKIFEKSSKEAKKKIKMRGAI
jgi:hypothetical protein